MNPKHMLTLTAYPETKTTFREFFLPGQIRNILENPGFLRQHGFDLRTLDSARIIKGTHYEVRNGDRKVLHLFEDGTFIARAFADETFLAWGSSEEGKEKRLNSLALIEFTYSFVRAYASLIEFLQPPPQRFTFRVDISNAILHESKLYLNPSPVKSIQWHTGNDISAAPEGSMTATISCTAEELSSIGRVSYLLVEKVYLWFGKSPEYVPYTSGELNERVIDPKAIKGEH